MLDLLITVLIHPLFVLIVYPLLVMWWVVDVTEQQRIREQNVVRRMND